MCIQEKERLLKMCVCVVKSTVLHYKDVWMDFPGGQC